MLYMLNNRMQMFLLLRRRRTKFARACKIFPTLLVRAKDADVLRLHESLYIL